MQNLLLKNVLKPASRAQEASHNLEKYYQKLSYANRYRYRSRMFFNPISYPPTIDGNEDYETSTAKEENQFIKKVLNIKKHPETPIFPNEYSVDGPPKGRIYEKLPFKFTVEKNKVYSFCTCGYSNSQPFCDGTHKMLWTTHLVKKYPKYRPIKYIATETKDVWFCNCKQSNNRPFCDGTHKLDIVQKGDSVK